MAWQLDFWNTAGQAIGVILGVTFVVLWLKSGKKWSLYDRLPGTPGLPFLGHALHLTQSGDLVGFMTKLADEFNGFFKLSLNGTPTVVISDPDHLRIFYSSKKMLSKASVYTYLTEAIGENLFEVGATRWKVLRKQLTHHFSHTPVEILLKNFLYVTKYPMAELRKKADGSFFPCVRIIQMAAARAILLNVADEEVEEELFVKLLDGVDHAMRTSFERYFSIFKFLFFRFTPDGWKVRKFGQDSLQLFRERTLKKMAQIKELKKSGTEFPKICAYSTLEEFGSDALEMVCREGLTLLLAGMDTTTGTIGFVLTILGLYPDIQEKVYQEDQEVQKRLAGREMEVDDLQCYEYLEMIIKETLRIFPVGVLMGRNLDEDTYFGEHLVPAGADVLAFQLYTNIHPDYFPDPLTFKEDRFSPQNAKNIPPHAFNPFSNGPRGCPGMKYAYVSMKIFITSFVREFRIFTKYESLEEAIKCAKVDFTLKDKNGYPIRLETRSQ